MKNGSIRIGLRPIEITRKRAEFGAAMHIIDIDGLIIMWVGFYNGFRFRYVHILAILIRPYANCLVTVGPQNVTFPKP